MASALPRSLSCRVRKLVAHRASPGRVARRASSLRCLGWPSRQAPLAGALSPWLHRNRGGPWRSPGKPCRGWLQLSVHKFGILGYPYSSTPTGAPGPGPYTATSVVGAGPKQGTSTCSLGYALSFSVSTAPSPTARVECGVVGEIVGGSLFGRAKRPPRPSL